MTELALIGLGGNVGDRDAYLNAARVALASVHGFSVLAVSTVEETAPCGLVPQGPYLNQMIALACVHEPLALLHELQRIENRLGRVRHRRWGPRTIDLDLVRYGNRHLTSPDLTLPHPGLASRGFWQREVAEMTAILARGR